jgi:F-type H+-transporting ATPase subunit epsilon
MVEVLFLTPQRVIFEGQAKSIILPGEEGTFEILPFHKDIFSRLLTGWVIIDEKEKVPIRRGIVKLEKNVATIIAELAS